MRRAVVFTVLALLVPLAIGGCGRKSTDPDARIRADIIRYGLPEVVARARELVEKQPTAANYDYLARAYAIGKQPKPAREALQKAVSLDPTYPPSAVMLGRVLMDEGKTPAAEKMMRSVLEKHPDSSRAAELLARTLLKQNRATEAQTVVEEALKRDGSSPELIWARADTRAILKQYDEAVRDYRRAIKLDPKNAPVRMSYTQTLVSMGKKEDAGKVALETVQMEPNSAEVRFMAASTLHQAGQLDEALKQYKETLTINPAMVPAANNLALLLADRNQDTGTSVAWARKAARLAPRSMAIADTLGWALARDGQYAEALRVLRPLSKAWTDSPAVWYHLGWTLVKSGQKAEGLSLLQKAAASSSDVAAEAQKALKELG